MSTWAQQGQRRIIAGSFRAGRTSGDRGTHARNGATGTHTIVKKPRQHRKAKGQGQRQDPILSHRLDLLPGYDPLLGSDGCWFDDGEACNAVGFIESLLTHVEGEKAGTPFVLEPWQKCFVANLFGWKRKDKLGREVRRYREAMLYVPRKNGKTPLAAAIALYVFFCDPEVGQQDYIAAADREQAGFLFRQAKGMVEAEPVLDERCRIFGGNASAGQSKSIVREADGSFLRVLSADANTKHGGNAHLVIIDELHAQPTRDLVDVLCTSTASLNRKQPLILYLTTADFYRESICNERYDYACKVRDGLVADQQYLPAIFEAANTDDWKHPDTWTKANPNLNVSVSLDYLEREARTAAENPSYENTFRRLHLNMRTEQDVRWLSMEAWDQCNGQFDHDELSGRRCWIGLDLANTLDVASSCAVFPPIAEDEPWKFIWRFWVPDAICINRERKNRTRFDAWINAGWMVRTPGDVIDFGVIRRQLNEDHTAYDVVNVLFDPYNATALCNDLMSDDIPCEKFLQQINSYNEACKKLEELLATRQMATGANPVARWMASNVATHEDGRGYRMPSRKRSTEKIDGIMAALMGLAGAIVEPAEGDNMVYLL